MRTYIHFLLIIALVPAAVLADEAKVSVWGSKSALSFEPNRGQTVAGIRYLARTADGIIIFTESGVALPGTDQATGFEFVHSNPDSSWEALEPTGNTVSYYIGRDPSRWVEGLERYRRLIRRRLYPGIDLVCYGKDNRLEYDFVLAPHADPARIRIRFTGIRGLSIAPDGALLVETPDGTVRHNSPVLYETLADGSKHRVRGAFRLIGRSEAGFATRGHDPARELSIDPVLESSTYFGGSSDDQVIAASGSTAVGNTTSIDFPGAAFGRRKGNDIFLQFSSGLNSQTLIYGGSGNTVVTSASLSSAGLIVVGGYTDAPDLPTNIFVQSQVPQPAWQPYFAGGATDGFVLLYGISSSAQGTMLSYLGTPGDDRVTAVATGPSYSSFAVAGTTNGRGLPSFGAPLFQGVPPDSAAGLDGFLITGSASALAYNSNLALGGTTYFGGSGDDTPTTVLLSLSGTYVAGETTSPDFPLVSPLYSTLNGSSDIFVTQWTSSAVPAASTLFGGSGTDRGARLGALSDGTILLAGVTSSTDLPMQNPAQGTYGGGASDGFLAMLAPDLSALKYATYIGGSGADEVTSLASELVYGGTAPAIFVGGWTASLDFPVQNAVQPQYGGGPDDGFLAHFDTLGNRQEATYFGGSGSDRVLGLYAPGASAALLVGRTTSSDLPTQNPAQPALKGVSDGFIARIGPAGFVATPVIGGKDLRSVAYFPIGNPAAAASTSVTVTSSDPSKVQLAASLTDPGQTSVQLTPALAGYGEYQGSFYADCLDDNGGADLTISAPGYADQVVRASCFPASIYMSTYTGSAYTNQFPVTTSLWAQPISINFRLYVFVPNQPQASVYPAGVRPGANLVSIQIATSNPAVGTLSTSVVTLGSLSSYSVGQLNFTPGAVGETDLSFSAPGATFLSNNPLHVVVAPPVTMTPQISIPSGFQAGLGFLHGTPPDPSLTITVTSQDPDSLVLTTDTRQPGTASVTTSVGSPVYAQAIASSGDITVTATLPGYDSVFSTVHITSPAVWFPNTVLPQPFVLGVGETTTLTASIGTDSQSYTRYSPNPGASLPISLGATNPSAVSISPNTANISGNSSFASFRVGGVTEGSTTLTLQTPQGIPLAANLRPVSIVVKKKPLILSDLELGKDLSAPMVLTLPSAAAASLTVRLTISNPALALLSPDGKGNGQAQLDVSIPAGRASLPFWVFGLAASGTVQVTAAVPGVGSTTANVILEPSGFAWNTDSYSNTLYVPPGGSTPAVLSFALDPATLLPVMQENVRPGASVTVSISNANPDVVSVVPTLTFPVVSNSVVLVNSKSAGKATLTLIPPAGFTVPSIRQQLAVTIQAPTFGLSDISLGRNLESPLQLINYSLVLGPATNDLPFTVTSSDPSRLLVSADPKTLGSESVTVNFSNRGNVTLQALDDHGSVTITLAMPTFNSGSAHVSLVPTGVGLAVNLNSPGATSQNGQYFTTTQSPRTTIAPAIFTLAPNGQALGTNLSLRPGMDPLQVNVTSSNTSVGTILNSPVTLSTVSYSQPSVSFVPSGIGQTDLTVSQPPGFVAIPGSSTLSFHVTAPGFVPGNVVLGKDLFAQSTVSLPPNVTAPLTNVAVTLTSPDPSQLLLSADAGSPPAPTITQTLIAGHNSLGPFYIHALGNSGILPISIQAAGYVDGMINVALADTTFVFNAFNIYSNGVQAIIQNGPQSLTVNPAVVFPKGLPQGYGAYPGTIRPGAPPITVDVTSSDPSTVSVANVPLVFSAGMTSASFTYQPLQPGQASLALSVPPGYAAPGASGTLNIAVSNAKLGFTASAMRVGRDLQAGINITGEGGFKQPATLTITSADPSRLVLSADGKSPGQGTLVVTTAANSNGYRPFYLQSLSDSGTVNVTVSADGYQTGVLPVSLTPSAAVFSAGTGQLNLLTNSGTQRAGVALAALDPVSLQPSGSYAMRPGANLAVTLTSSNPQVLALDTPSVQFTSPDPSVPPVVNASVRPAGIGTAILSLGLLPGGGIPASGGQLVVNVAEPNLFIPAFTLGRDLQAPVQIKLSSALPAPAADTVITVYSSYPMGLSSGPSGAGQFSLPVILPAGQHVSAPFYVQGFQTGTASLQYSGGTYGSQSVVGTVTQAAFIFREASQPQPMRLAGGSSATFTVLPALSPLASPVLTPLMIRGAAAPIVVTVTSSNPNVLAVTTPQLTLRPGDTQALVGVRAIAGGQATLTLSGNTYDFSTTQSTLVVAVQ